MPTGTYNFVQHNPTAANQDSDATFATDTARLNGFTPGTQVPHGPFQKEIFQATTWASAHALAMANKGFTCLDGSPSPDPGLVAPSAGVTALAAALANIVTNADFGGSVGTNGYVKLPNGLILAWGTSGTFPTGGTLESVTLSFSMFPTACFAVFGMLNGPATTGGGGTSAFCWASGLSRTGCTLNAQTSSAYPFNENVQAYWFAVGN